MSRTRYRPKTRQRKDWRQCSCWHCTKPFRPRPAPARFRWDGEVPEFPPVGQAYCVCGCCDHFDFPAPAQSGPGVG